MEAGVLLAVAKLAAFAGLVYLWRSAKRDAEEARAAKAEREAAARAAAQPETLDKAA